MKLPKPHFTVRRLMLIVAVVAVVLSGEKLRRAWRDRSLKAAEYAAEAESWSVDAARIQDMTAASRARGDVASLKRVAYLEEVVRSDRRLEGIYREKASRYARAARYPWLPVAPDPPEPK